MPGPLSLLASGTAPAKQRPSRLNVRLIVLLIVSFLRVLAAHLSIRAAQTARVQKAIMEGREIPEAPPIENAYGPWVDGWVTGLTVGVLLLLVHAARSLASGRSSNLAWKRVRALIAKRRATGPIT